MPYRLIVLVLVIGTCYPKKAHAQVVVSGDITGTGGTLTFQNDMSFNVTANGNLSGLIFDEWTINDGAGGLVTPSPGTQQFTYTIDGGGDQTAHIGGNLFGHPGALGAATVNDGLLLFGVIIPVTAGQNLTIKAGAFTFTGHPDFPAIGTFTGDVILAGPALESLSTPTAVPEPASFATLVASILFAAGLWKKRSLA